MTVSLSAVITLATQCAPNVAPQTVAAIVMTESRGEVFALNVNGASQPRMPTNAGDAAATARRFIAAGYSVDLGLGQINSRNMRKLRLTWDTVFDPCTNIAALGRILTENYQAVLADREPQTALRIALSLYNTGSRSRGFSNGYVERVVGNAGVSDRTAAGPPLSPIVGGDGRVTIVAKNTAFETVTTARDTPPPAWNIFARAAYTRRAAFPSAATRSRSVWTE